MPYTAEQRRQIHKKQERKHIKEGTPTITDLQDGVPTLRRVDGKGLVEFTRDGNSIYKKTLDKVATRPVSNATSAEESDTPQFGPTSLSTNGFVTFSNGLIIQWGTEGVVANTATDPLDFPTGFVTNCLNIVVSWNKTGTIGATDNFAAESVSKTQFQITNGMGADYDFNWMAIGN